jgi:Peptidase_C39 like family
VKNVPFIANCDETHCFQACLSMVLQSSLHQQLSWEELDKITGKKPGKITWQSQGILYLLDQGFEVIYIKDFDYTCFVELKEKYILERLGNVLGNILIQCSNIYDEIESATKLLQRLPLSCRPAQIEDIRKLLARGYLIICLVNWCRLNAHIGYEGHYVLVYDISETHIYIHDPGPPTNISHALTITEFEQAWAAPTKRDRNLIAIK